MSAYFLNSPSGQKLINNIAMRCAGELSELVGAMIYLASDLSSYANGTTLVADSEHLLRSL